MDNKCKECVEGGVRLCNSCKPATPEMVAETMEIFRMRLRFAWRRSSSSFLRRARSSALRSAGVFS